MCVARLGDGAAADPLATRVLARDHASVAHHTGAKVPGGHSFQVATSLIAAVARSGRRIVGFDLIEVVPAKDGSEWDENVRARLLYKLIGWTLKSRG